MPLSGSVSMTVTTFGADMSVGVQTMPRGAIWAGWRRAQAEAYATLLEALDQGHSFSWLAKPASTGFLSMYRLTFSNSPSFLIQ